MCVRWWHCVYLVHAWWCERISRCMQSVALSQLHIIWLVPKWVSAAVLSLVPGLFSYWRSREKCSHGRVALPSVCARASLPGKLLWWLGWRVQNKGNWLGKNSFISELHCGLSTSIMSTVERWVLTDCRFQFMVLGQHIWHATAPNWFVWSLQTA